MTKEGRLNFLEMNCTTKIEIRVKRRSSDYFDTNVKVFSEITKENLLLASWAPVGIFCREGRKPRGLSTVQEYIWL